MPCFWATMRGRWSGLVNHSRPRRIVSRLLVDVLHSFGEEEQTLSSACCPRTALHRSSRRAVVMKNAWRRYNNIVDSEMIDDDGYRLSTQHRIFALLERHHRATSNSQVTMRRKIANVILVVQTGTSIPKGYGDMAS